MVNIHKIFESNYLKVPDLEGKPRRVVIRESRMEEVGQDRERCLVIYFEDAAKGMILNKTNAFRLSSAFGPESDGWAGKEIIVYSEPTSYKGQPTEGLRVRVEQGPAATDDPIPF